MLLGRTASHELGIYQLGFTLIMLGNCTQNALISTPYTLLRSRLQGRECAAFAGSTLIHECIFSALAMLLMVFAGLASLSGVGPAGLGEVAWLMAIALPFVLVREFVRRVAFAHLQMKSVLVLDVAVSALQVSGLFILKVRGHLTGSAALGVIGVSCAVIGGLALVTMRNQFAPNRSRAMSDWRLNWSFGKWSFAAQLAYWTMVYSIPWILAILAGTDATGRFAACSSLVMIANPLLIGLNNYLAPQAVQSFHLGGFDALRRLTLRATLLMTTALGTLAIALMVFSDRLLKLVYGAPVADGNWVVAILAISLLFTANRLAWITACWRLDDSTSCSSRASRAWWPLWFPGAV